MAYRTQKVWLAYLSKYAYIRLNKITAPLLEECVSASGIKWCNSRVIQEKLLAHVSSYLEYGDIDERLLRWK